MSEREFEKRLLDKGYFKTDIAFMDFMDIVDEAPKNFQESIKQSDLKGM